MQFSKYHGLGNDFVVVDLRDGDHLIPSPQDPAVVRALCDRRFGVGGDGVLAVLPPVTGGADARMRVLNADGTEAEMCGNGLRCVVKFLHDRDAGARKSELTIDTGAGALRCEIAAAEGLAETVTVDMGRPRLTRAEVPMTGPADERCVDSPLTVGGRDLAISGVSMGNPHVVTFVGDHGPDLRRVAETLGPLIEGHELFPERANVEFAHVRSATEIDLVVFERGVGITLACGTGACATAVAACLTGRAELDTNIAVRLLGGDLTIRVAPDYATVFMTGSATHVFDADNDLAHVLATARPD